MITKRLLSYTSVIAVFLTGIASTAVAKVEGDTITPPEVEARRNDRMNSSGVTLHQKGFASKNESAPAGTDFRNSL